MIGKDVMLIFTSLSNLIFRRTCVV